MMPCTFVCIFSCQSVLPKVICIALFRRNSYVYIYKSLFISFLFCTYMYICHSLTQSLLWSILYFVFSFLFSFFSPVSHLILLACAVCRVSATKSDLLCFAEIWYGNEAIMLQAGTVWHGTGAMVGWRVEFLLSLSGGKRYWDSSAGRKGFRDGFKVATPAIQWQPAPIKKWAVGVWLLLMKALRRRA